MAQYKIKKGDTLTSIAKQYGTTVNDLVRLNSIKDPNVINAGATLNLPDAQVNPAVPPVQTTAQPQAPAPVLPAQTPVPSSAPMYQSGYNEQIKALLDKIQSQGAFKYDFNADPIYQKAKEAYTKQGKQAMEDTVGKSATLTGGFGNSYGQTAGQQVYQGYLQQLNDVVPELQQDAYGRYMDAQNRDMQNLDVLQGMENADYQRYLDEYNKWEANRNFDYSKQQDEQSQKNWQTEFDYRKTQDAQDQANWEKQYAASKASGGNTTQQASPYFDEYKATAQRALNMDGDQAAYDYLNGLAQSGMLTMDEAVALMNILNISLDNIKDTGSRKVASTYKAPAPSAELGRALGYQGIQSYRKQYGL